MGKNKRKKSEVRSVLENPGNSKLGEQGEESDIEEDCGQGDMIEDSSQIQALIKKGKSRAGHGSGSFRNE